jgi:hypothetical protein
MLFFFKKISKLELLLLLYIYEIIIESFDNLLSILFNINSIKEAFKIIAIYKLYLFIIFKD